MLYRAVLERWQTDNRLYVCDLPGCHFVARTVDVVMAGAQNAIRDYFRWARSHQLSLKGDSAVELSIIEEGHAQAGDIGPFFSSDLIALSADELALSFAISTAALGDVVRLYQEAGHSQRFYKHTPDELSADDILRHVARSDLWYATRLYNGYKPPSPPPLPEDSVAAVWFASDYVNQRLMEVFENGRSRKYEADFEEWSLTKVIRRRTAHLREHYPRMLLAVRQRMV